MSLLSVLSVPLKRIGLYLMLRNKIKKIIKEVTVKNGTIHLIKCESWNLYIQHEPYRFNKRKIDIDSQVVPVR